VFWALNALRDRIGPGAGAVVYTGIVEVVPGERAEWQFGATVDELMSADWPALAGNLAAQAHPVRLLLVREVLSGRRGVGDLARVEGLGTSGQLYHHLRHLVSAGWLRSSGRGQYVVPPDRVVPLLVTLLAARR
jgi:hypothetical protein